jgi:hypothetical protein
VADEVSVPQSEMNLLQLALLIKGDDRMAKSLKLCKYILEQHRIVNPKTKEVQFGFDPRIITMN